ncbi:hypothetical protein FGM00_13650 [Aggregatimonas sangjinii]|uniref:Uncharacterized protein n=1 Tax=Aggregatimonas sangjinii TaxID=2583587 RepID=A0A5B7SVR8_9FLAO|nr:hypothetical protein [Aggregatimonas sangjinii]QCX01108.1 hypothetical protein FGM00_13650 [Aggregatimonas sangjinii]
MKPEQKNQNTQNYRNFGITLLAIVVLMFVVGLVGYIGYSDGVEDRLSAYEAGRIFGRSLRHFIDYFVLSGLAFGSVFALLASLEKNRSFKWALLHVFLGWVYVVFYALTRKRILTDQR